MNEVRIEARGEGRFEVSGELSFDNVPALLRESVEHFEAGKALEIDLGGIVRADSAGIALLLEWTRRARCAGKTIRFLRVPTQMLSIIEVSDLEGLLPIAD